MAGCWAPCGKGAAWDQVLLALSTQLGRAAFHRQPASQPLLRLPPRPPKLHPLHFCHHPTPPHFQLLRPCPAGQWPGVELPKLLTVYLNPSNYTRDSFVLHPLVVLGASMAVTLAPEAAGAQRAALLLPLLGRAVAVRRRGGC